MVAARHSWTDSPSWRGVGAKLLRATSRLFLVACILPMGAAAVAQNVSIQFNGGDYVSGGVNYVTPAFSTFQEAYEWMRERAAIDVSTDLREFFAERDALRNQWVVYYSHNAFPTTERAQNVSFESNCANWPQGVEHSRINTERHYVYGPWPEIRLDGAATNGILTNACPPVNGHAWGIVWYPVLGVVESPLPPNSVKTAKNNCVTCSKGGSGADGPPHVGNPISPNTGNKYQIESDYRNSSAFHLGFTRYYNSATVPLTVLGPRWRHSFDRRIELSRNPALEYVTVYRANGQAYLFTRVGDSWVSDGDVTDHLTRLANLDGSLAGWELRTGSDELEQYAAEGHLVRVANRAGIAQDLSYDGTGRLAAVQDAHGRRLTFSYDGLGRLSGMTDPAGGLFQYEYDPTGRLARVTHPDGSAKTYVYENPSFPYSLTGIIDEKLDRYATFAYSSLGKGTLTEHAAGAGRYSLAYGSQSGPPTTITDPLQTARTYNAVTVQGVIKTTTISGLACPSCGPTSTQYDTNGFVSQTTDWNGRVKKFTRADPAGRRDLETSRTEAFGTPQSRTVTTAWHPVYRLPVRIVKPGRFTDLTYDDHGNLTSRTVTDTASGRLRRWTSTYTYSATVPGHVEQRVDDGPRTDVSDLTTTTYYPPDDPCLGCRGQVHTVANALGQVTTINAYDPHGRPTQVTDVNGLVTQLTYDPRGRLVSRDLGGEITTYQYDPVGQLTKLTLPDGSFLTYTYDAAHRLTGVSDAQGNRIVYTLDAMGNRTEENTLDAAGLLTRTHRREYDALNRLFRDIGAQAQTTEYGYDPQGNLTQVKDPLLNLSTHSYDVLNRRTDSTLPASGTVHYDYNPLDQLIGVTDPRNLATTYQRDALDNLATQLSPDTGATIKTFDDAGNVLTSTDAKGQVASYSYDALNRVTSVSHALPPGEAGPPVVQSWTWDSAVNGIGRLASFSDPSGTTHYAYDLHGRVTAETREIGGIQYTTAYAFDAAGRLSAITYPGGRRVSYGYDTVGRVKRIDAEKDGVVKPILAQVAWHPFGGPATLTFGNGASASRGQDLDGRTASYSLGSETRAIQYDPASRIIGIGTEIYGYDAAGRLTSHSSPNQSQGFAYDLVGNRTSKTVGPLTTQYSYPPDSHRLTGITPANASPQQLQYDANGSLTSDGEKSFAYDARGRMVRASTTAGASNYELNALGQRVRKAGPDTSRHYHYDREGRLIAESDPTGRVLTEYVWLGSTPVAVLEGAVGELYSLTGTDQSGNPASVSLDFAAGVARVQVPAVGVDLTLSPLGVYLQGSTAAPAPLAYPFTIQSPEPSAVGVSAGPGTAGFSPSIDLRLSSAAPHVTTGYVMVTPTRFENYGLALQADGSYTGTNLSGAGAARVRVDIPARTVWIGFNGGAETMYVVPAANWTTYASAQWVGVSYTIQDGPTSLTGSFSGSGAYTQAFLSVQEGSFQFLSLTLSGGRAEAPGPTLSVQADHLDTPRALIDEANRVVWRWESEPFGSSPPEEDPDGDGTPVTLNLRFPGQYFDRETGLHYNAFRDFDPLIGRYVQSDPIGLKGGINTFNYVRGNPLIHSDSLGLADGPKYEPHLWNDDGLIQLSNNCYTYAANRRNDLPSDSTQPGERSGQMYDESNFTCSEIKAAAIRDGFTTPTVGDSGCAAKCPDGYHKVQLVIAPDVDYHWYRRDAGGQWSHKRGRNPVENIDASGNTISCPSNANRDYSPWGGANYSIDCGILCAPN